MHRQGSDAFRHVVVPRRKVAGYLLAPAHPHGRHKARFFEAMGFHSERWLELASALRAHARRNGVAEIREARFGTLLVVEGTMEGPNGRVAALRVVWFLESRSTMPRLVTAYPLRRGRHDR